MVYKISPARRRGASELTTMDINEALRQWAAIKQEADRLAVLERQWRDYVVAAGFRGAPDGTHRAPLGNSAELKVILSSRTTVKNGPELHRAFGMAALYNERYATLSQTAFRWQPSLIRAEWDKLPKPVHDLFNDAITVTPNTPQMTIERKD